MLSKNQSHERYIYNELLQIQTEFKQHERYPFMPAHLEQVKSGIESGLLNYQYLHEGFHEIPTAMGGNVG